MLTRVLAQLAAAGALTGGGLAFYAWREGKRPELSETPVWLPGLPPALDGLRLLHLSDTHFPRNGESLGRFLAAVASLDYDVVVATGDYVETARGWPIALEAFRRIHPGAGIVATLGGHDAIAPLQGLGDAIALYGPGRRRRRALIDPAPFVDSLRAAGVTVLDNAATTLSVRGQRLGLMGVGDAWVGRADLEATLAQGAGEPADFRLLLSHSPDVALQPRAQAVPLILAGHTHGGQMRIPFYGAPVRHSRLVDRVRTAGLHQVGGTQVVISRGFGTAAIPLRFGCRPELGIVELRAAQTSDRGGSRSP